MVHLIGCDRPGEVFESENDTEFLTPMFFNGAKTEPICTSGTCALGPGDRRPFLIYKNDFTWLTRDRASSSQFPRKMGSYRVVSAF